MPYKVWKGFDSFPAILIQAVVNLRRSWMSRMRKGGAFLAASAFHNAAWWPQSNVDFILYLNLLYIQQHWVSNHVHHTHSRMPSVRTEDYVIISSELLWPIISSFKNMLDASSLTTYKCIIALCYYRAASMFECNGNRVSSNYGTYSAKQCNINSCSTMKITDEMEMKLWIVDPCNAFCSTDHETF